jgi:1-acyl-sn-glycerol-3-phosphate acyltransferase
MRKLLGKLYRVRLVGLEHIPASGGCILVASHESLIDPWILCLATPRRVRFMAKAELWNYRLGRWMMNAYGTFPVERGSGDTGAMTRAGELLDQGELLGMFPRGTSKPGGNRVWHRGAARLALAHGVPIIPVRLINTRQVLPRKRMAVLVGEPIEVERGRPTIGAAKALTKRAEEAIEALR